MMFDPELWKAMKGKGCWYCKYAPPVVYLDHTAQCFTCFARWFPTWTDKEVADWLENQWKKADRVPLREEARQLEMELAA